MIILATIDTQYKKSQNNLAVDRDTDQAVLLETCILAGSLSIPLKNLLSMQNAFPGKQLFALSSRKDIRKPVRARRILYVRSIGPRCSRNYAAHIHEAVAAANLPKPVACCAKTHTAVYSIIFPRAGDFVSRSERGGPPGNLKIVGRNVTRRLFSKVAMRVAENMF